jgi:hypothetical protein
VAIDGTWVTIEDAAGATRVARLDLDAEGDPTSIGDRVSPAAQSPAAVADCLKWVVYADSDDGHVHVYDWRHDVWYTEPDGVSIGVPAVADHAFGCIRSL